MQVHKMKVAFISVIRDDTDIMFNNLLYYYNIGIRDFYIMLHRPEPESFEIMDSLKEWRDDARFDVVVNNTEWHFHEVDCKTLTDMARRDGFLWIVGSDADELLVLRQHTTIQDFLAPYETDGYVSIRLKWGTYPPLDEVPPGVNVFTHLTGREEAWREQTKSIGRFNDRMAYVPGLHYITNAPREIMIDPEVAFYAHFPDRTGDQYEKKNMIQYANWMHRYGQFPLAEQIQADPDYLKKHWYLMLIANRNKKLIHDPINPELFNL